CCSRLARRSEASARAAGGFARTTKSHGGSSGRCRQHSRARRLRLFLSTARFAARREIVNPNRAVRTVFGRASTVKKRSLERAGSANTRPNSAAAVRRFARGNEDPADNEATPGLGAWKRGVS